MLYNKKFNQYPILAHGSGNITNIPFWNVLDNNPKLIDIYMPENLQIITFGNGKSFGQKTSNNFEQCLKLNNLPYSILGETIEIWQNIFKIELLYEFIESINKNYVLISDNSDVFIVNSLKELMNEFNKFNCDCLFNAEKLFWPPDTPKDIRKFEKSIHPKAYLNAGLFLCKTEFLKELLQFCLSIVPDTKYKSSDQIFYKYAYRKFYPRIKIDHQCQIFQYLNHVNIEELELTE